MPHRHYIRLEFGIEKDNSPEIYGFFFRHLPAVLNEMGKREAFIDIERLEPIDRIYSNLDVAAGEGQKIVDGFAKSHHLKEHASLTALGNKTSLRATVPVKNLGALLSEYNTIFDMFFANIRLKADTRLNLDMMDAFSNSVLVFGDEMVVEKFAGKVKERLKKTRIIPADPPAKK